MHAHHCNAPSPLHNGQCCLRRSFSRFRSPTASFSPLLAGTGGPGGPFLDFQMVVSPELFVPTFHSSSCGLDELVVE